MPCNPFNTNRANYEIDNIQISLKDGDSSIYRAENQSKENIYSAFKVESNKDIFQSTGNSNGLIEWTNGQMKCDFLLLKCHSDTVIGRAYFIECKSNSDIGKACKQIEASIISLKSVYQNWDVNYSSQIYGRVTHYGDPNRVPKNSCKQWRDLENLLGEDRVIIRNFELEPEILN